MDESRAAHVDLLRFWHAVETFSPQQVPELSRAVKDLRPLGPLPWESGSRYFPGERLRRDNVWRYSVYLGLYTQDRVDAVVERWGKPADAAYRNGRPGTTAVAALQVTDRGQLVAGSFVVSSCAWACGLCRAQPPSTERLAGLDQVQAREEARLQDLLRDVENDDEAVVSREVLSTTLERLTDTLGVEADLDPAGIRVEIGQVSRRSAAETDNDFLNSFFLRDLDTVAGHAAAGRVGPLLTSYLASSTPGGRIDIERDSHVLRLWLAPALTPVARWPAGSDRPLVAHQQFAVNHILDSLSPGGGMIAVNGPPGTGKTTLLRDLVAAIVVERADRLAGLRSAADAFAGSTRYSTEYSGTRSVHLWRSDLTGHEIVVASSNNGAVDNVVNEIPAVGAVDDGWASLTDHFADLATDLLHSGAEDTSNDTGDAREAWALLAARLGNRRNRSAFVDAFWFEPKEHEHSRRATGLRAILKAWAAQSPQESWTAATSRFRAASDRVDEARRTRQQAFQAIEGRAAVRRAVSDAESELGDAHGAARAAISSVETSERHLTAATSARDGARARVDEIEARRPPFWRPWSRRRWRESLAESYRSRADTEESLVAALLRHDEVVRDAEAARTRRAAAETRLGRARHHGHVNETLVEDAHRRWSSRIPSGNRPGPTESPWLDEEWNDARAALFLAALRLHRDFLRHAAQLMLDNLDLAVDVLKGSAPSDLSSSSRLAAWQSLFAAVPVVSTTFASFGRLFSGVEAEQLGWLFVDEAGQAPPQFAVGALWRSRRAVVVGDPLQLEPISSLSWPSREALREQHHVPPDTRAGPPSVQTRADERSAVGTHIGTTWVGSPLVVHRRCDEPVFGLVNAIAYDDSMVHGVGPRPELRTPHGPVAPSSRWIHVETGTSGTDGHWLQAEGAVLDRWLTTFRSYGQDMEQILLLGAFRDIAAQLTTRARRYGCGASGTVHTAQGKEADIVFLVLGGDPTRSGALTWASERPNLLNVAASRARRRLYVVGDRSRWGRLRYFDSLAARLLEQDTPSSG